MVKEAVVPDVRAYNILIQAHVQMGNTAQAAAVFEEVVRCVS